MGQEQQVDKETEEMVKRMADNLIAQAEKSSKVSTITDEEREEQKTRKGGFSRFFKRFLMVFGVLLVVGGVMMLAN